MAARPQESWRTVALGDVIELKRGYDLPTRDRAPGRFPIVSSSGPSGWHNEPKVRGPGVVTGRYGTVGEVFFVTDDFWPLNTALYVRDFKGSDPKFVCYFLKTFPWSKFIDKAAVPGVNRNHVHMEQVTWPPLQEQRGIANILGVLDDKIELNRRMNRTLEEMAQAIFKSWFIDFDGFPPEDLVDSELGPIPTGWDVGPLSNFADLNPEAWSAANRPDEVQYLDLASIKWGEISAFTPYRFDEAPSRARRVLRDGDTVIGTVRPANGSHGLILDPPPSATGSTGFAVLRPKRTEMTAFVYLWCTRCDFIEYLASVAHGSAYPAVASSVVADARAALPSSEALKRLEVAVMPMLRKTRANRAQSRTLGQIRDLLLPRLISGEIRVADAESAIGAAV